MSCHTEAVFNRYKKSDELQYIVLELSCPGKSLYRNRLKTNACKISAKESTRCMRQQFERAGLLFLLSQLI